MVHVHVYEHVCQADIAEVVELINKGLTGRVSQMHKLTELVYRRSVFIVDMLKGFITTLAVSVMDISVMRVFR